MPVKKGNIPNEKSWQRAVQMIKKQESIAPNIEERIEKG
jgi:hypothetical protein